MKPALLALGFALFLNTAVLARAEATVTYQVTGPIVELSDSKIVVQKGDEKWELTRDKNTKITGDVKVGSKVTILYRMIATKVDVKTAGAAEKKPAKKQ